MVQSLPELAAFTIPDAVSIADNGSGIGPIVEVNTEAATARLSLFGAHLLHWQPAGHGPVLWLSDGAVLDGRKAVRGGIPVCWPWFAGHREHAEWPSHGFARTTQWQLEDVKREGDVIRLTLALPNRSDHDTYWPHNTRPKLTFRIGATLDIALTVENVDTQPLTIGQALHTYFAVGEIDAVSVAGLEHNSFIDKLAATSESAAATGAPIEIGREIDRIYRGVSKPIVLHDPALSRTITITHSGGGNAIVWNPWVDKAARLGDMGAQGSHERMLCIETGSVAPDEFSLAPGARHTLSTQITVQSHTP